MVVSLSTQLAAQNTQALKQVWETIHSESCPYHYNFHMHTTCSDGQLTPLSLLEQSINIGLKGLAITDHHSIRGYQIAQNQLDERKQDNPAVLLPHLWTGVEVTSTLLDTEVHILGYGFDPQHAAMESYLQGERPQDEMAWAGNVINAIHHAGGLVVLAHPARYQRSADEVIAAAARLNIDGVEAYYAYGNPKPWKASEQETERVKHLSQVYRLFATCGTDTHGVNLLQRI